MHNERGYSRSDSCVTDISGGEDVLYQFVDDQLENVLLAAMMMDTPPRTAERLTPQKGIPLGDTAAANSTTDVFTSSQLPPDECRPNLLIDRTPPWTASAMSVGLTSGTGDIAGDITHDIVNDQLAQLYEPPERPARLHCAVAGIGNDPFHKPRKVDAREITSNVSTCDDLPVFKHLAKLEQAVINGNVASGQFPPIPRALAGAGQRIALSLSTPRGVCTASSTELARACGENRSRLIDLTTGAEQGSCPNSPRPTASLPPLRSARGCAGQAPAPPSSIAKPNKALRPGIADGNPVKQRPSPRMICQDGAWGLRPPLKAVPSKQSSAPPLAMGFGALRGNSLPNRRYGPAVTARWIATEGQRLASEAQKPKGSSAAYAFLLSQGASHVDTLGGELCRESTLA